MPTQFELFVRELRKEHHLPRRQHAVLTLPLTSIVAGSNDPFVREVEFTLNHFLDKAHDRTSYTYRYTPEPVFVKRLVGRLPAEMNALYWRDLAGMMGTYTLLTFWRAAELARAAIGSLNEGQLFAPGAAARSLMELFGQYAELSWQFRQAVELASEHWPDTMTGCPELEFELNRCLFGSGSKREPGHSDQTTKAIYYFPEGPDSKRVLNYLSPLAKQEGLEFLEASYDYLSDLVHPNGRGNHRFLRGEPLVRSDGTVSYEFALQPDFGSVHIEAVEHVLRIVSWASANFVLASGRMNPAIARIAEIFPLRR